MAHLDLRQIIIGPLRGGAGPAKVTGEFTYFPNHSSRRMEEEHSEPGLGESMPGPFHLHMAALSIRSQSTHRVQGLELLPQVSHSTLFVCVC